jgi:hypothetical protein
MYRGCVNHGLQPSCGTMPIKTKDLHQNLVEYIRPIKVLAFVGRQALALHLVKIVETHFWLVEAHLGVVEAHLGSKDAYHRDIKAQP